MTPHHHPTRRLHRPPRGRTDAATLARELEVSTALAVRAEEPDAEGWLRLEVTFQDSRHAEGALWQLSTDAEAMTPQSLCISLRNRAAAIASRYGDSS